MSATNWIREKAVREHLDLIIPDYQRYVGMPCVVQRGTAHPQTVGTAFDYALRFELKRRWPAGEDHALVARIAYAEEKRALSPRVREECEALFDTVADVTDRDVLARRCVQLAHLDVICRAGLLFFDEGKFLRPADDAIAQVAALLRIVPFDAFSAGPLRLNPTFGRFSVMVCGGDADLICGDRLVDIKTKAEMRIEREDARQLAAYFLLSKWEREEDERAAKIRHAEIYFSRHGKIRRVFSADEMVAMPQFQRTEAWLRVSAAEHGASIVARMDAALAELAQLAVPPQTRVATTFGDDARARAKGRQPRTRKGGVRASRPQSTSRRRAARSRSRA